MDNQRQQNRKVNSYEQILHMAVFFCLSRVGILPYSSTFLFVIRLLWNQLWWDKTKVSAYIFQIIWCLGGLGFESFL